LTEDETPFLVDWNLAAWITIHTHRTFLAIQGVTRQRPVQDQHQIAGTVVGALAGGLLGNQIGGGNGKKLATVAGAVAGGAAGRQIQGNHQNKTGDRVVERRCERVYR